VRLTRRGQRLLALLASAAFIGSLLTAFLIGEQQRCQRLSHTTSSYLYYCQEHTR
jgi:hypothetical protein